MAVDRIRKIDREALVDEIPETGQSGSMEEQVVNSVSLKVAMESLKPDEREIVDMKVAGGFTFREISEIVGKPMGTVTWLYNSAIKRLRRCRL
jgi:RNA polymerase sigma factor (sigma-70 family)